MTERIKLTEEDIGIGHVQGGVSVRFCSLEGEEIVWDIVAANKLKKQILEDQEKASSYNALNEFSKQQTALITKQVEEIKQLKKDDMNRQGLLSREMSMSASLLKQRDQYKQHNKELIALVEKANNNVERMLVIEEKNKKKLAKIKELHDNIDVGELDAPTIDILNELETILKGQS